jgi:hypothetical protein
VSILRILTFRLTKISHRRGRLKKGCIGSTQAAVTINYITNPLLFPCILKVPLINMSDSPNNSEPTSDSEISPLDLCSPSSDLFTNEYEAESKYDPSITTEDEKFIDDTELSNDGSSLYIPTERNRSASSESDLREEEHKEERDSEMNEDEEHDRCDCQNCYESLWSIP